jgi:hypothetical protein
MRDNEPTKCNKVTGKTAAPDDRPYEDSILGPISTARKQPSIGQTKKLLLAALRLWELKNGYPR